jgi:hypothetical protein
MKKVMKILRNTIDLIFINIIIINCGKKFLTKFHFITNNCYGSVSLCGKKNFFHNDTLPIF